MSVELDSHAFQEIYHFSGYETHAEQGIWLAQHGMLQTPSADYKLITECPWNMPGSESYVMQFAVATPGNDIRRFISKACVKLPVIPSFGDWVGRREILEAEGVITPKLHALGRACLIEEYIPYDLRTAYTLADSPTKSRLQEQFVSTCQSIWRLGFRPVRLHDLRSHGDDVVLIDFGSDLGGIHSNTWTYNKQVAADRACDEFNSILGLSY